MIDFACKQFNLDDIVKCALALTKSDFEVLRFFMKNLDLDATSEKVAESVNINLSTSQRALKKLHEKNILIRSQKNLSSGGYIFTYQIKDKTELKSMIRSIIEKWFQKVDEELKRW
jgi:predicted transcriptional regulator